MAKPMRLALAVLILTTVPAAAWEFTPTPVCTLSHETASASLTVSYDPGQPEPYAIAVTNAAPWPDAPVFSMMFEGRQSLTISSRRQKFSQGGRTLTITDKGFGNVLNGLEFNTTATAILGDTSIPFPLEGAAPQVKAFRACIAAPTA